MAHAPFMKPDRPSPEQIAAWRVMTFEQKLELADQLRTNALRLREASLRQQEPDLPEDKIRERLHEYPLNGAA